METLESKVEGLQTGLVGPMCTSPMEISTPLLVVGSMFAPLPLRAALPVDSNCLLPSLSHMVTHFQGDGDEERKGMAVKGIINPLLLFQLSGKQVKAV